MILDIDIGNTRVKYRFGIAPGATVTTCTHDELLQHLATGGLQGVAAVRIASVARGNVVATLRQGLERLGVHNIVEVVSSSHCAGVTNSYAEPQRLGVDRWLAMIAAYNRLRSPCIVIDAGSAATLDVVDAGGVHQGGWIVPGLAMLRGALITGTAAVRFDSDVVPSLALGCNTGAAVHNGTLLMLVAWLNTSVVALLEKYANAHIVLCGGDGPVLRGHLGFASLHWPDIVLDGLALIPLGE